MADRAASAPRPDPLNAGERLVVSVVAQLATVWMHPGDVYLMKARLRAGLPHLRRGDPDFERLAEAVARILAAQPDSALADARAVAARDLQPILRRDMAAALRDLPDKA